MNRIQQPAKTGNIVDLAFAMVVLAAYFTIFSNIHTISGPWLIAIIVLGVVYISIGIYGFSFCVLSNSLPQRISYFVSQIITGNLILYLGNATGFNAMILLPLTAHSVVLLPEIWRYAMNVMLAVSYGATLHLLTGSWDTVIANLPVFMAGQVFVLVFTQMVLTEVKSRREIQQLADELGVANQQLRKYAAQVEMLAVERERNRLAREIHDGVGHHLTAANMQVKAARAVLFSDPQRSDLMLSNAEYLTQRALIDIRQSVSALRESQADGKNLVGLINGLISNAENSGLVVTLEVLGEPRGILPEAHLTIFRAVQESISNTLKHAQATQMSVCLDYVSPEYVRVLLCDNGVGSELHDGGYGLLGMRERVNLLDGSLNIKTSIGHGFEIEIMIPEHK